jgi:hypothetical protein
MIQDTRKKAAEDKLKVICSAILKDDSFLNFGEGSEVALSENDFDYMDLLKYYDENHELKVLKNELGSGDTTVITYTLNLKDNTNSKEYQYTFDYIEYAEKYNYNIEFDEANGVNRPIVVDGMVPLMPDGVTPVNDIYKDNWYSYKVNNPNFAKMKYQDRIYVWIPRFAYNIQSFYENRSATNVPSSAIQIVYLKDISFVAYKKARAKHHEYKWGEVHIQINKQIIKCKYVKDCEMVAKELFTLIEKAKEQEINDIFGE